MVEYIAMRDSVERPKRVHAFLSAWHRTADADQRDELKTQNLEVFSITTQKMVDAFLSWLKKKRFQGKSIVLHLDECDHGTGAKQMLSKVWEVARDTESITNILYSATPEEVLYSGEVDDVELNAMMGEMVSEGHHVEYMPPAGYCGPARFLAADLVQEALPCFLRSGEERDTYTLSPQGKQIVADLRACIAATPSRNLLVLRLSYSELGGKQADIKKNKAFYQFLENIGKFPELADFLVVVDKGDITGIKNDQIITEKIQWSSSTYWRRQASAIPILLVIDQTSSRSTEWACHDRLFATHDFRNVVQYSTISQAQERVNHYEQRYGGFQPIRVYGHTRTFKLSAGLIDYTTFLTDAWEKKKIDVRVSPVPMFRVRSTAAGHALHAECGEAGMTEAEADRLLQRLGCFADVSLSARVCGSVKQTPVTTCAFLECDEENFGTVWPAYRSNPANGFAPAESTRVQNPFTTSKAKRGLLEGRYRGFLRNWDKVLDYEEDVSKSLWGMGEGGAPMRLFVCYKGDKLGVAVKRRTGWEMKNTLRAYKSMYIGSD